MKKKRLWACGWFLGISLSVLLITEPAGAEEPAEGDSPSAEAKETADDGTETGVPEGEKLSASVPASLVALADEGELVARLPSLERILELTKEEAPDVAMGNAMVTASRATSVGARRPPVGNPLLTVFAEHGPRVTEDVFIDGTLEFPIELWGQRGSRIRESDAFVAWNEAGLDVARSQSTAQAIMAYGQVVVARERIAVLEDAIQAAQTEASVYRARLERQDATMRDAQMATMEVARNQILLVEANADLQTGLAELARLTGIVFESVPRASQLSPPSALTAVPSPEKSIDAPLVKQSKAEAEYFDRVHERAGKEGKMPFSLLLRGGRGDLAEARLGGGVVVGFPVFQKNQGERARAEAEAERARKMTKIQKRALDATLEGIKREIRQLSEAKHVLERTALPAATEAVESAEEIQKSGKGDLLAILISRRDYAALRLRRLEIIARQWRACAQLVSITGASL